MNTDADTASTIFVTIFLFLMAALALFVGQRSPAENLTETTIEWKGETTHVYEGD